MPLMILTEVIGTSLYTKNERLVIDEKSIIKHKKEFLASIET
jgi:hypothetical protein